MTLHDTPRPLLDSRPRRELSAWQRSIFARVRATARDAHALRSRFIRDYYCYYYYYFVITAEMSDN